MIELFKCFSCRKDQFRNQLKEVKTPSSIIHLLCGDCHDDLMGLLADKGVMGERYKNTMTMAERKRLARERGRGYARSDFEMGAV